MSESPVTVNANTKLTQAENDAQVIALWIHGRSPHTQRAYRANAERFLALTGKPIAHISLSDIQAFADALIGLAQSSRAQALAAIKSLLAFAHKIGYIPVNVGAALQLPKTKNTLAERILQESEVHSMIALEPSQRNRLILKTLYFGAFRVSELCGLRWRDLRSLSVKSEKSHRTDNRDLGNLSHTDYLGSHPRSWLAFWDPPAERRLDPIGTLELGAHL